MEKLTVVKLKKVNLKGKKVGETDVADHLVNAKAHSQMCKDYIVAIRENQRQWSACTKTRSEVKHTTKKSSPQKGTGGARHGSLVAAQFRGGGIVFGPKPKFNQHVRINQKERKAVNRALIAEMLKNDRVLVLESTEMESPKTKELSQFLKSCDLTKRVLFVGESERQTIEVEGKEKSVSVKSNKHTNFVKSLKNIPKMEFSLAMNLNGYNLMNAQNLVITEPALKELTEWLS